MQKQESQARQNNNSLFTSIIRQSQGLLVPPQELQIFFWASSLSCFANTKAPTRGKKLTACWEAAHRPSRVGIRRLMKTSPYYLTTSNQKVVHKLITHSETLSLALSLKSLPRTIRVQILWVWAAHSAHSYCLILIAWPPHWALAINTILFFTWCQHVGFTAGRLEDSSLVQ